MNALHTDTQHTAAERAKAPPAKPKLNGEPASERTDSLFKMPDFQSGLAAASEGFGAFVKAAQAIGREQALIFNEEVSVLSAEMEALKRSQDLQEATNSLLKCAQLQADLAIHGSRMIADTMRHSWFEMLSNMNRPFKLPFPDLFRGIGSGEDKSGVAH